MQVMGSDGHWNINYQTQEEVEAMSKQFYTDEEVLCPNCGIPFIVEHFGNSQRVHCEKCQIAGTCRGV